MDIVKGFSCKNVINFNLQILIKPRLLFTVDVYSFIVTIPYANEDPVYKLPVGLSVKNQKLCIKDVKYRWI